MTLRIFQRISAYILLTIRILSTINKRCNENENKRMLVKTCKNVLYEVRKFVDDIYKIIYHQRSLQQEIEKERES
jgi:DNA anti-recombination protein RmuC